MKVIELAICFHYLEINSSEFFFKEQTLLLTFKTESDLQTSCINLII